jgi:hypothetical protein
VSPVALGSSHDESETGDLGPGGSNTAPLPTPPDTDNPHSEPEKPPSDSEENRARYLTPVISPKHVINQNSKTTLSPNSLEMLTRLFPNKKRSVLELVLRRCGDDLLKAIEEIVPRDVCHNVASGSANLQSSNALHQYLASYKATVSSESTKEEAGRVETVNSARSSSSVLKSAFKPVSPSTSVNISPNTSSAIGFGHHSNLNSTPEFFVGNSAMLSPPTAHQSSLPFAATMSSLLALQNHQTNNSTTSRLMSTMFYPPSDLLFQAPHLPFAHSAALFTNSLSPSFYMTGSNETTEQQFFNPYRNSAASGSSADLCCNVPGCDECSGENGASHQQGRKSYSKMSVN